MVKKFTSLLLVGVLLLHLAGFYVYFIVRLGDLRMNMREKLTELPEEQLEAVRIPVHEFKASWIKEKEMKWQGKMFDIARVEHQDDFVMVYCLHDKDEDGLLNFIGAVINMSRQDTRSAPPAVIQFFSLKYILAPFAFPERPVKQITIPVCSYQASFNPVYIHPVTPPPQG